MRKQPMRMCAICREKKDKRNLIRIVNNADEGVLVDLSGKLNGRGAYICSNSECINNNHARKILSDALKTEIAEDVFCEIKNKIERNI